MAVYVREDSPAESGGVTVLTLWQIDSFEGGRGSRAEYLRSIGESFSSDENVYIDVTSLSAEAARDNIAAGVVPDMISYGSGFYGLETIVSGGDSTVWCRGGYCLLALGQDDFSEVTSENTVINAGKDNLIGVAALFEGLNGADVAQPTAAYVSLLDGQYRYLLGTQRDIVRLQTRGAEFSVLPLFQFNDLYQNISVITTNVRKIAYCERYIEYLLENSDKIEKLSMLFDGIKLYDDELGMLENLQFGYTIPAIVGEEAVDRIKTAVAEGDINMVKSLLKSL